MEERYTICVNYSIGLRAKETPLPARLLLDLKQGISSYVHV